MYMRVCMADIERFISFYPCTLSSSSDMVMFASAIYARIFKIEDKALIRGLEAGQECSEEVEGAVELLIKGLGE